MAATGRFEGHAVLITGAGRGIGAATARRFASEGAAVLLTDVDGERAAKAAAALRADGLGAESLACDVADDAAVRAAVDRAVDRFGRLDVLVNNAFSCQPDPPLVEDYPDEVWARDLDVTLTGALRCVRAAMPHLAAAGGRGSVVSVGSVNGEQDFGNHAYSAAKAGLASLTRTLAGQCAPRGVRVNLVAPGTVHTPNWDGREEALERAAAFYPLGRVGRPEDVAAAVAFLASPDAAWITGVTLPVDGGILIGNVGLRAALRGPGQDLGGSSGRLRSGTPE
ncbi:MULTISPECIES: SDR family NAD(P)-dependent oxidoreductase [Streptomyces]|uniref:SDR family oxidoreductase n=1 Tax=Streptomyces griseocarneus TaxID=51201 RepID=A0ABX7RHM3_9ACTN|nr:MULTISPECIES: SDR family NAD(P)-dependent oxidoreductase [Streptomyces]QSY47272.1 SDR family oxidoreductase [Streptomyces griseocarneus]